MSMLVIPVYFSPSMCPQYSKEQGAVSSDWTEGTAGTAGDADL